MYVHSLMVLSLIAGVVIVSVLWLVMFLFVRRVNGLLQFLIALGLGFLVLYALAEWFGIFGQLGIAQRGDRVALAIGILLVTFVLFRAGKVMRRVVLFVLAGILGLIMSALLLRRFDRSDVSSDVDEPVIDKAVVDDEPELPAPSERSCVTPRGSTMAHGSVVDAYQVRSSGVCDMQRRVCQDGVLDGSYTLPQCPADSGERVYQRTDFNTPNADRATRDGYIRLAPGLDGSQWYEGYYTLDGLKADDTPQIINGIEVYPPDPRWEVEPVMIYDCVTPRGEYVEHSNFVVAYDQPYSVEGDVCQIQLRMCRDGELLGDYQYGSCQFRGAR